MTDYSDKSLDGLERLLEFINFLRKEKIYFAIGSKSEVSITVDFGLPGVRIEVDFYPDEMVFASFPGSEAVSSDDDVLDALLLRFGEIDRRRPRSNR